MFFDQVDDKNTMVQSALGFEKIGKRTMIQVCFLAIDDRNMMIESIMHFEQFWVSARTKWQPPALGRRGRAGPRPVWGGVGPRFFLRG